MKKYLPIDLTTKYDHAFYVALLRTIYYTPITDYNLFLYKKNLRYTTKVNNKIFRELPKIIGDFVQGVINYEKILTNRSNS